MRVVEGKVKYTVSEGRNFYLIISPKREKEFFEISFNEKIDVEKKLLELVGKDVKIWLNRSSFIYEVEVFIDERWVVIWGVMPKKFIPLKNLSIETRNKIFFEFRKQIFNMIRDERLEQRFAKVSRGTYTGTLLGNVIDAEDGETELLALAWKNGSKELKNLLAKFREIAPGLFSDLRFNILREKSFREAKTIEFMQDTPIDDLVDIFGKIERYYRAGRQPE